jgi:CubicO group peptidase (beta-lactamase class C family)
MSCSPFAPLAALITVAALTPTVAHAVPQTPAEQSREVDALVQQQMAAHHIPGASVAVVSHGKVALLRAYGLADAENRVPVTEHTAFELASVTKQFTATAIMMLVQDGKLSLDDTITNVVDSLPAVWRTITIRHLLNHTSGIPEFARPEFRLDKLTDHSHREIIQLVANAPLDFAPGDKHSYSNTGYFLLGMVIERIAGMDYGTFLHARIFQPLAMHDSRFNDRHAIIANRARGYSFDDGMLRNAPYIVPETPFAAGGLISSAADMATWMQAQGSEKLLTRANWEQMWAPARLNDGQSASYGFGWYVKRDWSKKRVEHGGGIEGFKTYVTHFVDDSLAVVVLTNVDNSLGRIPWHIWGVYLPGTRYQPPKPIADTDTATTSLLRRAAVALSQGTGDSSWYTPKVQRYYFPDRIKIRKATLGSFGSAKTFDLTEVKDENGRQKRTYRAIFGTTPLHFTFWLTPDRKIDDVDWEVE